jgi:hypothetical protein
MNTSRSREVAAWQAVRHHESALSVVDGDGRFVGIISPHRLVEVLSEHEEDLFTSRRLPQGRINRATKCSWAYGSQSNRSARVPRSAVSEEDRGGVAPIREAASMRKISRGSGLFRTDGPRGTSPSYCPEEHAVSAVREGYSPAHQQPFVAATLMV